MTFSSLPDTGIENTTATNQISFKQRGFNSFIHLSLGKLNVNNLLLELDKKPSSKFQKTYRILTTEEGQRVQWPKHCKYSE